MVSSVGPFILKFKNYFGSSMSIEFKNIKILFLIFYLFKCESLH